jgi:hypothetical protein
MPVETLPPYVFDMAGLFARLGEHGRDLVTRPIGERALPLLEDAIRAVPDGETLSLDLHDIVVMDASFADAAILSLQGQLIDGQYGDRFLILASPNDTVVFNLEGALARRKARAPLPVGDMGGLRLAGHLERNLHEAWDLVAGGVVTRARELADHLGLEIGAASMRLHKLYVARLLTRREESAPTGRQLVYRLPE